MDPASPSESEPRLPWTTRLLIRVIGHVTHLAMAAGVMLALALLTGLQPTDALLGFAAIAAIIVALPQPTTRIETIVAPEAGVPAVAAVLTDYGRMADALTDPCLILDSRAIVLHANPLAADQFPALRAGAPLAFALRHPALITAVDAVITDNAPRSIEISRTAPTESVHKVNLTRLADPAGGPAFVLVTLRDRTEEKRIDAMRSDFIANASHELRTPLTSLVGFIDTLLGPAANDPAARARFLTIMQGQAARMSKLIDDLLSLSRIELRQHVRPTASLDLGALIGQVREGLQTQAKAAGLEIVFDPPEPAVMVTGDRDELYEVFENLLDNAIKYGEGGGSVEIAIGPATGRHGFETMVSITDHGPGIAPEHVPRLTERFYRVDAESSRKKKGTGLGLAIVKHILTRHRGQLVIRSTPGTGTRAEVLLVR